MIAPEILAALSPVEAALDQLGVAHLVAGSIASSIHGVARTTLDADVVASLLQEHVTPLANALEQHYYVSEEAVRDAVRRRASFNVIHLATMIKVDIFVLEGRAYDRQAMDRRLSVPFDRRPGDPGLVVASPEDTILGKIEWFRAGGEVEGRQWRDVVGVLKVQGDALDLDYLRRWAHELDVSELLERAFDDAWGGPAPS